VAAIRAAGRGESLLDPSVTRAVLDRLDELSRAPARAEDALSEREKEVLLLIAQGCTNKEIAAKLVVSPYTARNHVSHILGKLGFSRRSEAASGGPPRPDRRGQVRAGSTEKELRTGGALSVHLALFLTGRRPMQGRRSTHLKPKAG
jgi:DNA-binding CsgD family transcriptional regulator